jgi:copper transport protein
MIAALRALAAALGLATIALPGAAHAHASLVASQPADGARVPAAPAQVLLQFDEPVVAGSIRLLGGARPALALTSAVRSDGAALVVALPAALAEGHYVLAYRVTSVDSHVIDGAIAFSVGADSAPHAAPHAASPAAEATSDGQASAQRATRVVHLLALLTAAGLALRTLAVPAAGGVGAAWLVAAALLCTASAARGVWLHGSRLAPDADSAAAMLRAGLATTRATSAGVAAAGSALLVAAASVHAGRLRTLALAAGALLLVVSPALSGHAASAQPRALAALATTAHVAAGAFWLAALMGFASAPAWRGEQVGVTLANLRRFSTWAQPAVVALALAAAALAWLQLRSVPVAGWLGSDYTIWLAVKAALLVLLLALAADNRYRLLDAAAEGQPAARRRLHRQIRLELVLIGAAAVAAALLATTPPPRPRDAAPDATIAAGAVSPAGERVVRAEADGWRARLVVSPARAGQNTLDLFIDAIDRTRTAPRELALVLSLDRAGIAGLERRPVPVAPGHYRWTGPELAVEGDWRVDLLLRASDFDVQRVSLTVPIAAAAPATPSTEAAPAAPPPPAQ